MGFPEISIIFKSVASSVVKRGARGVVYAILRDITANKGVFEMTSAALIPAGLSAYNKQQLQFIFMGGSSAPKKVIAYVQDAAPTDIAEPLKYAEAIKFDYLCVPGGTVPECTAAASAVKSMRTNLNKMVKAVLPNTAADSEAIVNFTTDGIVCGTSTYAAKDFCSRITGLLAGTPLSDSVTFTALSEVTDIPRISKTDAGVAIDMGKLILFHDGEKVKVARGVNSMITLGADRSEQFRKIKIVSILDTIRQDITATAEDNYIGKVSNSYANKLLLVNAINNYLAQLEMEGLLEKGQNAAGIDVEAQRAYLKVNGFNTDIMEDNDIKAANTRDQVFLTATIRVVDSIESITFNILL